MRVWLKIQLSIVIFNELLAKILYHTKVVHNLDYQSAVCSEMHTSACQRAKQQNNQSAVAGSQLCCALDKFSKNRFCGDRWGVCSFLRRIRPSGSGPKINFTKNFGSGGDVVTRDSVISSETPW